MASYTSNLNLKKPALTDDALVTDLNDNSDKLDAAISAGSGAIAIVSVGNTHAAISSGQYVYVRQHGSLSEGLYKATTNIAANGTLSGSNLTAVSGGGLNSVYSTLSDQIAKSSVNTGISDFTLTQAGNIVTACSVSASIASLVGYTIQSAKCPATTIRCPCCIRDASNNVMIGAVSIGVTGGISFLGASTYGGKYAAVTTGSADFSISWAV